MKSAFALTHEVIDMDVAVQELLAGISELTQQTNSLGILFCDSEIEDYATLIRMLREKLGFDIVGCTTAATLNSRDGISEMSSSLMVLTADDVFFHTALSNPLSKDLAAQIVEETWTQAVDAFGRDPSMILAYPPHNPALRLSLDLFPQELSRLSGNLPVFGGLPGHNTPYGVNAVVYNDNIYQDRMLMILLGGNIRPLCSVGFELSHLADGASLVTEAEGNIIKSIDNKPFFNYLHNTGLDPQKLMEDETKILFASNPMVFTIPGRSMEDYALIRTLYNLDMENGWGILIGRVPEGHATAIGTLTRKNIKQATERAVSELLQRIAEQEKLHPEYKYTTILASSCVGRFMVMTPKTEIEGDVFKELIPDHLNFMGYYGYGEIGPYTKNGKVVNTSQNETITLCAL